ncbi:MAG: hypothetical protein MJ239_05880 [Bacilli bacterium]|nr:hypothetical protein [Bacilli bacterium]
MAAYFEYLREMFIAVMTNIGNWFADPWKPVPAEFDYYNSLLAQYSKDFGGAGWVFYVIFMILLIAAIGAFCFLIFWLIRKYVRFRKSTASEEALRAEVEKLNLELYQAISEKERILGLQISSLGVAKPNGEIINGPAEEVEGEIAESDVRFPRLALVDKSYENYHLVTTLPEDATNIDLKGICERFRNFAASQMGLYYTIDTIRVFFSAMGTGKIIILEGISGTGKTSLPYALGRFFKHNAAICSVQPSWRDRSELLGYYNDFTHKFTETQFLHAIYEATYRDDVSLVVLDEMNLARIEYYFAEFLSIMEMPNVAEWNISLVAAPRSDDPSHVKDGRLLIPQNIWFIGTANNDDSTFTITDKVYDRAMSLFFDNKGIAFKAPFTEALPLPIDYLDDLFKKAKEDFPLSQKTLEKFQELDSFVIEHFKLAFGNRIMKQLGDFVPCYIACGGTELEAVDYMFQSKILKKFEVLNVAFLRDELIALDAYLTKQFGKGEFLLSKKKIKNLIKMSA